MKEPPGRVRQEAVDEEVVFLEAERLVLAVEVAGAVVGDPMTQDEVLRSRRCANRVGLYEAKAVDGVRQGRWREEGMRQGKTTQVGNRRLRADGCLLTAGG